MKLRPSSQSHLMARYVALGLLCDRVVPPCAHGTL